MIAGRPTNLWLGLIGAITGGVGPLLLFAGVDPVLVAAGLSAFAGIGGAFIALIANQPPTLSAGDTYHIQTPAGQPNYEATVAAPPAATKPTVDIDAAKEPAP